MDFSQIGLTNRDKRVYEALLNNPQSSLRTVAEVTGINRGSVFESVKDLMRAGLVTKITIGKRQRYRAKDPEILHEIISEHRQELLAQHASVDQYIKQFVGVGSDPTQFHFASFYEGDEGTAAMLRDVLKTCRRESISRYRVISSPRVSRYLYNNFPHFTRERIKQGLFVRVLRQGKPLRELAADAETRYLSNENVDTGCYTIIYGGKVAIIAIDEYNNTSGVIIDQSNFATIQKMLFDASWRVVAAS